MAPTSQLRIAGVRAIFSRTWVQSGSPLRGTITESEAASPAGTMLSVLNAVFIAVAISVTARRSSASSVSPASACQLLVPVTAVARDPRAAERHIDRGRAVIGSANHSDSQQHILRVVAGGESVNRVGPAVAA